MSVSILEVLESAGYDVRHNKDDAEWLLNQEDEFDDLCEEAQDFLEREEENEQELE